MESRENKGHEQGLVIGVVIIGLFVLANVAIFRMDTADDPKVMIWTGLYLYFIGTIFLTAYYFEEKSFIFRWAVWICENFSYPKSKKMAFFYFGLSMLVGTGAIIESLAK